jgi:cytochrome P450
MVEMVETIEAGNAGIKAAIKAEAIEGVSRNNRPVAGHRHPTYWSEPEKFDPSRFQEPTQARQPAFMAFGAGGRTCVGDRFAIDTVMPILTDIFQNLELELDRSHPVGTSFQNVTLRTHPLNIRVRPALPH